jgi:homopolymeric O-antigen transport system ATP-binding protein
VVKRPVSNEAELTLELQIEEAETDCALAIDYGLYTDEGLPLWYSYQTDEAADRWPKLEKGLVRLHPTLPAKLLNEGRYRLEIYFSSP